MRDTKSDYCGTARPTQRSTKELLPWSSYSFTCRRRPASSSRTGKEMKGFLNRACASVLVLRPPWVTVKNTLPSLCVPVDSQPSKVTSWSMQESGWSRWKELRITLSLVVGRWFENCFNKMYQEIWNWLLGKLSESQLWNTQWEKATTSTPFQGSGEKIPWKKGSPSA